MQEKLLQLSAEIRDNNFNFLEPRIYSISEIYDLVKSHYESLCDDDYLCSQNCNSQHNQPEWKHVVRRCINRNKTMGILISEGRGKWRKVNL